MFTGPSFVTLDAKGRLAVPTRHREVLTTNAVGQLTVTKHTERCLMLWPRAEWEQFAARLAVLPGEAQWFKRIYLGSATQVEMDGTGRVLIAPELREFAGITRETLLIGMGNYFELWDKGSYEAEEAKAIAGPRPEALKDFAF